MGFQEGSYVFNHVTPYRYLLPIVYLPVADIEIHLSRDLPIS